MCLKTTKYIIHIQSYSYMASQCHAKWLSINTTKKFHPFSAYRLRVPTLPRSIHLNSLSSSKNIKTTNLRNSSSGHHIVFGGDASNLNRHVESVKRDSQRSKSKVPPACIVRCRLLKCIQFALHSTPFSSCALARLLSGATYICYRYSSDIRFGLARLGNARQDKVR